MSEEKVDVFAQIGARRAEVKANLVEIAPPTLEDRLVPTGEAAKAALPALPQKLETEAQFKEALASLRKECAPFLANHAPALASARKQIDLRTWSWRMETEQDRKDFCATVRGEGKWDSVSIPHYGGPIGRNTAYYRTEFTLSQDAFALGALILRFDGVDYKAHVLVNGAYVGSHEGMFAPFEFDITGYTREGLNNIVVRVENDAPGNGGFGLPTDGDKIYAATGLGWDDPQLGWHHCPPGMGIYNNVTVESRTPVHIVDLFVRTLADRKSAELWVEVYNTKVANTPVGIEFAVFGRNFKADVVKWNAAPGIEKAGPGISYYRTGLSIPEPKLWEPKTPWLYQMQVRLLDEKGAVLDTAQRAFGLRTFELDTTGEPKGEFRLNGRSIRLRGVNTMGHEQQCVAKGDFDQLRDDILITKLANVNFWRLTQRPVQREIYELCDQLGMMTQTDLPLFSYLRRNQFAEAVRQCCEMERLIRGHACNIVVSYINEPFPQSWGRKEHRVLTRAELETFFTAADQAVRLYNPDRVIKPIDGDYDAPGPGLPDHHCYSGWYIGHGLELGKINKGYWLPVKPGWNFGCGEYGAEGLEDAGLMRRHYPKSWLPQTPEEERTWVPNKIVKCQTGDMYGLWIDRQESLEAWVDASQRHQEWSVRLMTEAFRRNNRMITFALHLGIDAFPSGWMKTIVDCERRPKRAFFAFGDALTPLAANIRADRWAYFGGELARAEFWLCNDTHTIPEGAKLVYGLKVAGKPVQAWSCPAKVEAGRATFQGKFEYPLPEVDVRTGAALTLALTDAAGKVLHHTEIALDLFPRSMVAPAKRPIYVVQGSRGDAARLAWEMGVPTTTNLKAAGVILVDDPAAYAARKAEIEAAAAAGARVLLLDWPQGDYTVDGKPVTVKNAGMDAYQFASRKTGHALVAGFETNDFRFWLNPDIDRVGAISETQMVGEPEGWSPILMLHDGGWGGAWKRSWGAAERKVGNGSIVNCQLKLAGRVTANPVAKLFASRLLQA